MSRQFFAPVGSGLGDVIVSLPIIKSLIARGSPTFLVANSARQLGLTACIKGLSGTVTRPELSTMHLTGEDLVVDFLSHPMQTDHIWGSRAFEARFPQIRITEILQKICNDFCIEADLSRIERMDCRTCDDFAGMTALIPGTVTDTKSWSLSNWIELSHRLDREGQKVLLIGEPQRNVVVSELIEAGLTWIHTPEIIDAIEVISGVKRVISVDTGLMHVAINQGIDTIALFESNPIYYRPAANCFPLFAGSCQPECRRRLEEFSPRTANETEWCWYDGEFNRCSAVDADRCMSAISVEQVMDLVAVASHPPAAG